MRLFVAIMMSLATLLIQPSTNALTLQSSAGGPRVFCYTAYDSDFFYLAATISKPRLVGNQSKYFSDAVKDDCITVFIDTNPDSKAKVRSPRSVQMAVSAAGGVQLYRGATATPLSGFGDFLQGVDGSPKAFKIGLTRKGTVNGASASDNGFTVELAIPWIELGGAPTVGQKMRFNVASLTAESEGSGIYSISPALKSSADMQNPSLWSEIIFVDAPVKSVADAPNAKVCARLFSSKPLIDGIIDEAVWSTVTAFAFGADKSANPIGPVTPGLGAARVRITHPVKKAQPAILPLPFPAVNLPTTHIAQATPNLVFAKYVMNIQNDSRKALPIRSVRGPDGNVNLSNHPMDGSGPWYTYDRVDWHSRQLADMRQSGVDAALVVWRPIGPNDDVIFPQGLAAMRGALDHLWRTGQEYPQVGLQLDLSGLQEKASAFSANQVFGYIRTFYRSIPARYRASVELSEANSGLRGVVLTITGSTKKCPVSTDEITLFRKQFASEFGADLVILGRAEWAETLKTDGYLPASGGASTRWSEGGWIKTAVVSPGRDAVMGMTPADTGLARKDGQTYRSGWTEIGRRRPDWVIIDSWNNFVDGTAVAASLQNGLLYTDLTRLYSASLTSSSPGHACKVISFDSPNIFVSSSVTKALLRISNGTLGAITPEGHFFGLQWRKADGTAVGPLIRAPFPNIVGTGLSATVPVVLPVPREVGDYHLDGELFAVRLGKNEVQDPHQLVVSKLKIIAQDEVKKSQSIRVLRQDLPAGVESGGFYQVNAMLRNDSGFTWKASAGGTVMAHLWKTSLVNGESEPMDISDASVAITSDVLPGQTTNVTVPLLLANSSDAALIRTWTGTDNWIYEIRYEFQGMDAAAGSAVSPPEPIAVYDADFGVQITSDFTPGQLPGERRLPVKMSVKNFGSQTWLKDRVRVGYHWYFLDGTEAIWQDETTPLPMDLVPGAEATDMLAYVTAPPHDGVYWLEWDIRVGETWTSTIPSTRPYETGLHLVEVVKGRSYSLDLDKGFNFDGVSGNNPRDGNFDGIGRTIPAELLPPYTSSDVAPAMFNLAARGIGLDSSKRISFRWPVKADKQFNMVQCVGQKLSMGELKKIEVSKFVHVLAASTKSDTIGAFTIVFQDGTQQLATFLLSKWDAPPVHGEEVGWYCRYSRTQLGDAYDHPVALFHYVIKIGDQKKVAAIILPNKPEIKIAAITMEK